MNTTMSRDQQTIRIGMSILCLFVALMSFTLAFLPLDLNANTNQAFDIVFYVFGFVASLLAVALLLEAMSDSDRSWFGWACYLSGVWTLVLLIVILSTPNALIHYFVTGVGFAFAAMMIVDQNQRPTNQAPAPGSPLRRPLPASARRPLPNFRATPPQALTNPG